MALFSRNPKATVTDLSEVRAELVALRSEVTKRANELSLLTASINTLEQRLTLFDQRLSATSAEMSNQLHELGNEIQALIDKQEDPASLAALEQLRINQTRIANEQARYEIAFRQDLAMLAEIIRENR
jgi:predicted  nucleic acid-binding Zn-ribbon protein